MSRCFGQLHQSLSRIAVPVPPSSCSPHLLPLMDEATALEQGWADAGASAPPPRLYLDTVSATGFAATYKRQTFELMHAGPGARVLDVGCGTGDDVVALARLVGPSGTAVGVDSDAVLVAEGWRRATAAGVRAEFRLGDAHRLPFDAGSFDAVRADRAVQHMETPAQVVAELRRVTRPGGRIVVGEPDWETLVVDSPRREITRRIAHHLTDHLVRHGWIGRQLARLFAEAGLVDVTVHGGAMVLTDRQAAERIWGLGRHARAAARAGAVDATEVEAWLAELDEADRRGVFFSATVGFVAAGRVP